MRSIEQDDKKSTRKFPVRSAALIALASAGGYLGANAVVDRTPKLSTACKADVAKQTKSLETSQKIGTNFQAEIFKVERGMPSKSTQFNHYGEVVIRNGDKTVMIDPLLIRCGGKVVKYAAAASSTKVETIDANNDNKPELLGSGTLQDTEEITVHYQGHGFVDNNNRRYAVDPHVPMIQSEPAAG